MKLTLLRLLLIASIGAFILNTPVMVQARTIDVVSFNTQRGTPRGSCPDPDDMIPAKWTKVENIANWIVATKPDVALLQEMVTNCDLVEEEMLATKLQEKGYPMEYVAQQQLRGHMNVVTFSRLPILRDQVQEFIDHPPEPARAFLMVPIQLPEGTLYTFNAHIRHREPQQCPGLQTLTAAAATKLDEMSIVGGDFNLRMLDGSFGCSKSLRDAFREIYDFQGSGIDFLAIPHNGPLSFERVWWGGSPDSDHPAIWATLKLPDVTCTIQGYKRFSETPEVPIRVIVDGNTTLPTTTNPYFVDVNPGQHTVRIQPPTQTTAGYTLCYNRTDCHSQTPTQGNSVQVTCQNNQYIDLWWHISGIPEPTPTNTPPPTPTPTPVCANDPDIDRSGTVDIVDYSILIQNFGQNVTAANANSDINCTNTIDIFDYAILIVAFNES